MNIIISPKELNEVHGGYITHLSQLSIYVSFLSMAIPTTFIGAALGAYLSASALEKIGESTGVEFSQSTENAVRGSSMAIFAYHAFYLAAAGSQYYGLEPGHYNVVQTVW